MARETKNKARKEHSWFKGYVHPYDYNMLLLIGMLGFGIVVSVLLILFQ